MRELELLLLSARAYVAIPTTTGRAPRAVPPELLLGTPATTGRADDLAHIRPEPATPPERRPHAVTPPPLRSDEPEPSKLNDATLEMDSASPACRIELRPDCPGNDHHAEQDVVHLRAPCQRD